jgi:hypothetical protein
LLSAARPAARSAGAPRNEQERLALLRRHQERVREQQEKLDRCPDLIGFKIGIYEDILRGNTDAAEDRAS